MIRRLLDRLDDYATGDVDFHEDHPEDRCPLCEWPVCDRPGQRGFDNLPPRAKWPHRRAALRELLDEQIDRAAARLLR